MKATRSLFVLVVGLMASACQNKATREHQLRYEATVRQVCCSVEPGKAYVYWYAPGQTGTTFQFCALSSTTLDGTFWAVGNHYQFPQASSERNWR